jgi:hypothetical protein
MMDYGEVCSVILGVIPPEIAVPGVVVAACAVLSTMIKEPPPTAPRLLRLMFVVVNIVGQNYGNARNAPSVNERAPSPPPPGS